MNDRVFPSVARGAQSGVSSPFSLLRDLLSTLLLWHERARQRHHLGRLDARMLADLGLTRSDVESELAKPFWRP